MHILDKNPGGMIAGVILGATPLPFFLRFLSGFAARGNPFEGSLLWPIVSTAVAVLCFILYLREREGMGGCLLMGVTAGCTGLVGWMPMLVGAFLGAGIQSLITRTRRG